ncbi:MAG: hypothetical protein K2O15_00175 [Lachnospiraceae bacterium]|nr:hypothetical protein [Lachnospiraceae bacterium]
MLEILYSHNIQCEYQVYCEQQEFKEYIDYCIESALPVLVGIHVTELMQGSRDENPAVTGNTDCIGEGTAEHGEPGDHGGEKRQNPAKNKDVGHVIQIIGHTDVETGKEYIVYDDSGYYLKSLGLSGFVGCVNWEKLSESLKAGKDFIIYPIHEKVYILYENFKKHVNDILRLSNTSEGVNDGEADESAGRTMLIDNRDVKRFLQEKMVSDQPVRQDIYDEALKLISMDMPHYLWCYECRMSMGYMLFFADPTYNRRTTKNIFMNRVPLICSSQIGLLRYD